MLQSTQIDSGFTETLPLNSQVSHNKMADEFNPSDKLKAPRDIRPQVESINSLPQPKTEDESLVIKLEGDLPSGPGFVTEGNPTSLSDDQTHRRDIDKPLPKTRGFLSRGNGPVPTSEPGALPKLSKELEEELKSLAIRYKKDWKKISKRFFTLTNKHYTPFELRQISKTMENSQAKKLKFTDEEDRELITAYLKLGPDWLKIVEQFPGRCPLSLRCRYYVLKKQGKFKSNAIVSANILSETELNANEIFTNIKTKKVKTKPKKPKKVIKQKPAPKSKVAESLLSDPTSNAESPLNPPKNSPKQVTPKILPTKPISHSVDLGENKLPEPRIPKLRSARTAGIRNLDPKIEEDIKMKIETEELKIPQKINVSEKLFVPPVLPSPDLTLYKLLELKRQQQMMYPNMLEYLMMMNCFGFPRLV